MHCLSFENKVFLDNGIGEPGSPFRPMDPTGLDSELRHRNQSIERKRREDFEKKQQEAKFVRTCWN